MHYYQIPSYPPFLEVGEQNSFAVSSLPLWQRGIEGDFKNNQMPR